MRAVTCGGSASAGTGPGHRGVHAWVCRKQARVFVQPAGAAHRASPPCDRPRLARNNGPGL